jgi:hypothetical protein
MTDPAVDELAVLRAIEDMERRAHADLGETLQRAQLIATRAERPDDALRTMLDDAVGEWRAYFEWFLQPPTGSTAPIPRIAESASAVLRRLDDWLAARLREWAKR